ncbi:MAG: aminotransferase class I/II-fold pyridoxal phosphate-dependent enzyme [bacterium]
MILDTFLISFIAVFLLTPLVIKLSGIFGWYDKPGRLKIHTKPIPKLGGLVFFAALFMALPKIGFYGYLPGILTAVGMLGIVCVIDDTKRVSPILRFGFQFLAGAILAFSGLRVGFLPEYFSLPLTIFWVMGMTNSFNLVDGLDGLAAGLAFIAASFFLVYSLLIGNILAASLAALVAGSALAFLKYNFHPAKIFMGDTGSVFFGLILAVVGLLTTMHRDNAWPLLIPVLILGMPILDTSVSVVRRLLSRRPLFDGDREHLYDLLIIRQGMSQQRAVLIFWLGGVAFGWFALMLRPETLLTHFLFVGILGSISLVFFQVKKGIFDPDAPSNIQIAKPSLPDYTAIEEDFKEILASGQITNADYVDRFEVKTAAYLGVKHAVAVANCTSGLILALKALGLKGEVILPSFTFSATAHALLWNNLTPVFVDCDPETFTLDPELIEAKITSRTAAIVAVYVSGVPPKIERLEEIAKKHDLRLIFDAAHAFGAKYQGRLAGSFGDVEVFSLSPTKILTAGEGGIVATNNDELARLIRIGRDYGNSGDYDPEFAGLNARLSELHAALGIKNLELVEQYIRNRQALAALYKAELGDLPGIKFQKVNGGDRTTYKDLSVLIDPAKFGLSRDRLAEALAEKNIATKKYYFPPVHRQKVYQTFTAGSLPVTDRVASEVIDLPLYSQMKKEDVLRVCRAVKRARGKNFTMPDQQKGQAVMVTGAGGSIGREVCFQLAAQGAREMILLERDENRTHYLTQELALRFPNLRFTALILDIKEEKRLREIFGRFRPEVVFHAAAHKHVYLMEEHPIEAAANNVLGTKSVAELAHEFGVAEFVLVSTDKAVYPKNVMGATKRLAEKVLQELAGRSQTKYVIVRFGNVIESEGSVIPLFKKQIASGGPITITHPEMARFFMTIPEAVELIIQAARLGKSGHIYCLDMGEPVKIVDLARELIEQSGREIEIKYVGLRAGETLNEFLHVQSDSLEKTEHPRILAAGNGYCLNRAEFGQTIEELKRLVATMDETSLKQKIIEAGNDNG